MHALLRVHPVRVSLLAGLAVAAFLLARVGQSIVTDTARDVPNGIASRACAQGTTRVYAVAEDALNLPPDVGYDFTVPLSCIPNVFQPDVQPEMRALVISRQLLQTAQPNSLTYSALNAVLDGGHLLFALQSDPADIIQYLQGEDARSMASMDVSDSDMAGYVGSGYFYNWALGTWSIVELGGTQAPYDGPPLPPGVPVPNGEVRCDEVYGFLLGEVTGDIAPNYGLLDQVDPEVSYGLNDVLDVGMYRTAWPSNVKDDGQRHLACGPSGHATKQARVLAPDNQWTQPEELPWHPPCPPGRACPDPNGGAQQVGPGYFSSGVPVFPDGSNH